LYKNRSISQEQGGAILSFMHTHTPPHTHSHIHLLSIFTIKLGVTDHTPFPLAEAPKY